MEARLVFKTGANAGMILRITKDVTALGRGLENDVSILDVKVSKKHCVVEKRDKRFFIKDLESTNGTYLNGAAINEEELYNEDELCIGDNIIITDIPRLKKRGMMAILHDTMDEMKQGKGYETILEELVGETKDIDFKKVKQSLLSGDEQTSLVKTLSSLGYTKLEIESILKEAKKEHVETFTKKDIVWTVSPKKNNKVIRMRKKLKDVEVASIVEFEGKDYIVVDIKENKENKTTEYKLREC